MRTLKTTMYCWISVLFLLNIAGNVQSAVNYKDTIWVDVTYFDFHADSTNPEFEQRHYSGLIKNMVDSTLDADSLPVLGPVVGLNKYIQYWFRPWDSPKGAKTIAQKIVPYYNVIRNSQGNDTALFVDLRPTTHDTAFKNLKFEDSLPFVRMSNSELYQFEDSTFYPLDGKGFGAEGKRDNRGNLHNYSFTMALHYRFTKSSNSVQQKLTFTGDDDVWAFVNKKLVLDVGGVHEPRSDVFTVSNALTPGVDYSFDFFFAERHTTQSDIKIQTNLFQHQEDTIELEIKPNATVKCGDSVKVFASVIHDGDTIKNAGANISWVFDESAKNAESTLWGNIPSPGKRVGDFVTFSPTEAYFEDGTPAYVIIEATTLDTIKNKLVHSKARIDILPGNPHHLVIEEKKEVTLKNKLNDNPLGSIFFDSARTQANAYAIVRDKDGNYVRLADSLLTIWGQKEPIISTNGEVPNKKYHGIFDRMTDVGNTIAFVKEGALLPDSIDVTLTKKCIPELRLLDKNKKVITSIVMFTDDSSTFYVEGNSSTNLDEWTIVPAKWELSAILKSTTTLPDQNSQWTFDPTNAGKGELKLSRPFDTSCFSRPVLIVPVTVKLSPPNKIDLTIITPEQNRIAGDTLVAVVKIRNTDGSIPGEYCFGNGGEESQSVIYQDTLKNPSSGKRPVPQIQVDGVWTNLNMGFTSVIKNDQCFMNGVDTIKFISYYAVSDPKDGLHLLTVDIGQSRTDQVSFTVLPAILDSIDITDGNHKSITNVETFISGESGRPYYSVGYDKYGNKRGDEPTNWKTSGDIIEISIISTAGVNYGPGKVDVTKDGFLISEVVVNGKNIQDKIGIHVEGLPAKLLSAYTHDDNGNGYLDRVSLTFDKKVTIAEDATSLFNINGMSKVFKVTKILPIDGEGLRYSVYLEESKSPADAQTDWKPLISTSGQSDFSAISSSCLDSAAPVVWTAIKTVSDPRNTTKDVLVITMSEKVKRADNNNFSTTNQPDLTFYVWKKNALDSTKYDNVPLLKDISGFQETSVNTFTILMTNGSDITDNNYINIKAIDSTLTDVDRNFPGENNFKRRVQIIVPPGPPVVIPNPTSPSFVHTGPGVLVLAHDASARKFARDGLGAAINVLLPHAIPGETVISHIKIYDLVGNIVNTSYNNDFLKVSESIAAGAGSVHSVDIYWNGSNAKGMKVAPGIYKTVLYFAYSQKSTKNLRYIVNIGIKK